MLLGARLILLFVGVAAVRVTRSGLSRNIAKSGTDRPICADIGGGEVWATCAGRGIWKWGSGSNTQKDIGNCNYALTHGEYYKYQLRCPTNYIDVKPICRRWGDDVVWLTCRNDARPLQRYTTGGDIEAHIRNCNWAIDANFRHVGCPTMPAAYSPAPIKSSNQGYCLESKGADTVVGYGYCNGQASQDWYWNGDTLRTVHLGGSWCLDHSKHLRRCNGGSSQMWTTTGYYPDFLFGISAKHGEHYLDVGLGDQWYPSGAIQVAGRWVPKHGIVDTIQWSNCRGTSKTTSATRSQEWSNAVEISMTVGFEAFGFESSMTVSTSFSRTIAESHTQEFQMSTQECFTQTLYEEPNQTYLWQWEFEVNSDGVEITWTATRDLAKTASRNQPPRCLPGYANDIPMYQDCVDGTWLP